MRMKPVPPGFVSELADLIRLKPPVAQYISRISFTASILSELLQGVASENNASAGIEDERHQLPSLDVCELLGDVVVLDRHM